MRVTILAFAQLRERLGWSERVLELPDGTTAGQAARLALAGLPEPGPVLLAVGEDWAPPERPLADGETLALLPPLGGG